MTVAVVTSVATICIAAFVAVIGFNQWRISREKLRLDLFNRRFDVYMRVVDYHLALNEWKNKPEQLAVVVPFIKAVRESRFIFPKDSGVHPLLEEFQQRANTISSYFETRDALKDAPQERAELGQRKLENGLWIARNMSTLEDTMEPYIGFDRL